MSKTNEIVSKKSSEDKGSPEESSVEGPSNTTVKAPKNSETKIAGSGPATDQGARPVGPLTPGKIQVPIPNNYHSPYSNFPFRVSPHYGPPPPPPATFLSHPAVHHSMTKAANPHKYTDVSTLNDPVPDMRRNRGGVMEIFPEKLHRMLEETERDGHSDVVSFFGHGRAFAIHKPRRFASEIMSQYFKQTRLTSFQRQLNLYGFRRISQGPDNGGYYHELFLKGRPGLCVNMKRTRVKGNGKSKRDAENEPNFYSYPPIKAQPSSAVSPAGPSSVSSPPSIYPGYPYPPQPNTVGPYTAAQKHFAGTVSQPPRPVAPYTAAQQSTPPSYPYMSPFYGWPVPNTNFPSPPKPVAAAPAGTEASSKPVPAAAPVIKAGKSPSKTKVVRV